VVFGLIPPTEGAPSRMGQNQTSTHSEWHGPENIRTAAATESGIGGEPDAPERPLGGRGDSRN
jgi:hypothetical protein